MSELYELPDGWEWTKLKNVCNLLNGYAFKANDYVEKSDTVLIRMGNIRPNGSFDADHKIQYLPNQFANELPNFILKEGDLIIAMTDLATEMRILGNPTLVTNLNNRTFMLNQRVGKLCDFDFSKVTIEYLRYIITAPQIKEYYKSLGGGGLQINIGKQQILSVDFPLPPLSEQQRIVSKLDLLFEKIDKSIALHQKNMDEANAFMGSVLNDVFGELEDKYGLKQINSLFKIKSGNFLPKKNMIENGDIDVYGGNGINGKHNEFNLSGKNIIIGRVGALCGNVRCVNKSIWLTDNAFYISEYLEEMDKNYLTQMLIHIDLGSSANQSAQPVISYKSISELEIPLPPLPIQQKTVIYLDEISQKTEKIKQLQKGKMASLKALKASILDSAFRGEL